MNSLSETACLKFALMNNDDYKVTSELYEEHDYSSFSKPATDKNNVVSKFKFQFPPLAAQVDADGDLLVSRKAEEKYGIIEIEHSKSTVLGLVGLQIWRGALLLADWLLANKNSFKSGDYILELGSGVGLTSVVAAMFSPVLCTDVNRAGLLDLIKSNISRNKHLTKFGTEVSELDFKGSILPEKIVKSLAKTPVIIAADVVYDNEITEAFVKTVEYLLSHPPKRSVYVALEKRYVFTISDCDTVAPCYEYFLECLQKRQNIEMEQIPLDFPQYFQYDRIKELVLWKITSKF